MYDLSDLIRGKGHGHAKPQTKPKQKSKPKTEKSKKKLKSEKKKKTKPDEQKDEVESDHKENADTKNTTPDSDIENLQQKTETEKVEDQKDPPIKSDKETETEQQQSADKKREAKPTGLIELDPIFKAFANVHTMDQALELLDISDEDKPKKSIAVESEIDMGIGVMKVQEYALKQLNKKDVNSVVHMKDMMNFFLLKASSISIFKQCTKQHLNARNVTKVTTQQTD